ncbi:uncharacterized protein Dana_GF17296 [Drosophila ananassae]|uniref:Reticulon-like protein n=1 Tax=Drosophila ananassae TaxID=7217 RepID=B3LYI1_DROAN|nr:reticulon-3 [Drosophila ananassae]EDV41844.1 uncharacterized protein Dana_GF17296 [Drosophila ananassae]
MISKNPKPAENPSQLLEVVKHLVLWRNYRQSLVVFTSILLLLLDVMAHSVISVVSMAGITVLLASIGYRCFVKLMRSWRKDVGQNQAHRLYPQANIDIPREEVMRLAGIGVDHINAAINHLLELFLIENWEESLKFLVAMCGLNLLGDCFNGLTLLMFGHVFLFTLPKLYEWYKPNIDVQIQKFRKCKSMENAAEPKPDNGDTLKGEKKISYENKEATDGPMLYKVCDNAEIFDLLEEEHSKGCRCRDCEHQDLPIEAH